MASNSFHRIQIQISNLKNRSLGFLDTFATDLTDFQCLTNFESLTFYT